MVSKDHFFCSGYLWSRYKSSFLFGPLSGLLSYQKNVCYSRHSPCWGFSITGNLESKIVLLNLLRKLTIGQWHKQQANNISHIVSKITLKNLGVLNLKHATFHYDNQYALHIAKNVVFMNALNILILTVILLDTRVT